MIASHQARVDPHSIETLLVFVDIGRIIQAVVIVRIVHTERREQTKQLWRARSHAMSRLIQQGLFQCSNDEDSKERHGMSIESGDRRAKIPQQEIEA